MNVNDKFTVCNNTKQLFVNVTKRNIIQIIWNAAVISFKISLLTGNS